MNLFELAAKITIDTKDYEQGIEKAGDKANSFASKIGPGLAAAAKVGAAAVTAAATGIATLTVTAINNYAEYEQLVGGVETLFKNSADTVQEYAANAYKTAGMSANEYMETVTGFSASLLQSLEWDTEKAAKYADMAITDMSDNANKMGTSIEMIQNAYGGFAKQNFTMLDNLKLGYGGTKEEMQRLLDDARKISGIKYDISSYADVVEAIHVIQESMGIAGTTAAEASETISGSISSMQAAWSNLLVGFADDAADFPQLVDNFVDSAVTAAGNILPRIGVVLSTLSTTLTDFVPEIFASLSAGMDTHGPQILETATTLILNLVDGMVKMLPSVANFAVELILALATGISGAIPQLLPTIINVVVEIARTLTNPTTLKNIINAAPMIISALVQGITNSVKTLLDVAPKLLIELVSAIIQSLPILLEASVEILEALAAGIAENVLIIGNTAFDMISAIGVGISKAWRSITEIGSNIVEGVWQGIQDKKDYFFEQVKGFFSGIVDGVKDLLEISSPSKVFAEIGKFMAEGLDVGFDNEVNVVHSHVFEGVKSLIPSIEALQIPSYSNGTGGTGGLLGNGGTSYGDINLYIDKMENSNGRDVETLMQEIEFIRRQQAVARGFA